MKRLSKRIYGIFICSLVFVMMFSMPVFAREDASASRTSLNNYISTRVAGNKYQTTTGGYYEGRNIVTDDALVDSDRFADLKDSAKAQLVNDMNKAADEKIAKDKTGNKNGASVSDDTKSDWLSELQKCNGMGSHIMMNTLGRTKPDFVKAGRIWAPFESPLGTILALLAIVIGAGIMLTVAIDLAWIGIPFFRALGGGGEGKDRPKLVSFEAYSSVQEAEGGSGGDGGKGIAKIAVWTYFKRRALMLLALGVCLLYLVQGEIFTGLGMILDLVSGLIGF